MTRDIIIVGCGGFGRSTAVVVDAINRESPEAPAWNLIGFVDDGPKPADVEKVSRRGSRVLGNVEDAARDLAKVNFVIGIGSGKVRERICACLEGAGLVSATLIHPNAHIGVNTVIGAGSIVCVGVAVDPDVTIGRHVHLNKNCIVGHDAELGDFSTISPVSVVGGYSHIGRSSTMGMQSVTLPGVTIGNDVYVGAAACVADNVSDGLTVKGVPAR